ncbi:3-oxoacyl-[acyl-carrier protein] reductase [Acidisarcina polymorpha]|uniref:3-oxoacyl-[acyl-carrier protein] reductase n=1 Tax=Acidisarcina polymorpha TaxID=2211140 RepID=A0A2Z5FY60_9BACT|nr:glucose 1-dehydrogenase [Acidisarcina polymorpha]AXC11819.1 3-oxoacyl-[acyl-carrier protein] reductase [Acidisarcina polymorpha]
MKRLENRVAVVTGSSSGIGQTIAQKLAEEGAHLVIDYIGHREGADETLRMVQAAGAKGIIVQADVSKLDAVKELIDQGWSAFGSVDILVNNAGMEKRAAFVDVTEEEYDQVLAVNLKGPFFLTQVFVQRLRSAKKSGRIINISSVHEDMAFPNFSTYCASKGGVRMLMRDLAVELGPEGFTVNNVAPGAIVTPINKSLLDDKPKLNALLANIPLGRLGTTDDVANLVAFLASDEAAYVNGATYTIDGGLSRSYHEQ